MAHRLGSALVILAGILAAFTGDFAIGMGFACPEPPSRTLREEARDAGMIVYGRVVARPESRAAEDSSGADLLIDHVLKGHPALGRRKVLPLPAGRVEGPEGHPQRMVVFVDVSGGQVDPFRGIVDPDGEVCAYLQMALALPANDPRQAVLYFFRHLEDTNQVVAADALLEFMRFKHADLRAAAPALPADQIVRRLQMPGGMTQRLDLYAQLLGLCGTGEQAEVLEPRLDDPKLQTVGPWIGYVLLRPEAGRARLRSTLADDSREFVARYAALRALRWLHQERPDLMSRKEMAEALCLLLHQPDIADLAIEDLRKEKCWAEADRVLGLCREPVSKVPVVRRALIRYALGCKGSDEAACFIAREREKKSQEIQDAEELLRLEAEQPAAK